MLCKRDTKDPLIVAMREQYGLVPVSPPRQGIVVGTVLVFERDVCIAATGLSGLFSDLAEVSSEMVAQQSLDTLLDQMSTAVDVRTGLALIAPALGAWLGIEALADAKASLRTVGAAKLAVSVQGGVQRQADLGRLEQLIAAAKPRDASPFLRNGLQSFLVYRTWAATKGAMAIFDAKENEIELDASVLDTLKGKGSFEVEKNSKRRMTFGNSGVPVCFAIDGVGIGFSEGRASLDVLKRPQGSARGDEEGAVEIGRRLLDVATGDAALLEIPEASAATA